MRKHEDADPYEYKHLVKTDTPQQNDLDLMRRHNTPRNYQTYKIRMATLLDLHLPKDGCSQPGISQISAGSGPADTLRGEPLPQRHFLQMAARLAEMQNETDGSIDDRSAV
jgi:hypothetical protein